MSGGLMLWAALLAGCWSSAPPEPPEALPEAWVPAARGEIENPMVAGGEAPSVGLRFRGVGALHRGYVGEVAASLGLPALLAPCARGEAVLSVDYEEPVRHGRMLVDVGTEALRCHARMEGDTLHLGELSKLGAVAASVQKELAATRDIRFYAFDLGLHVRDHLGGVTLWFTGKEPQDGSLIGRCVGVDGTLWCDESVAERAGTTAVRFSNPVVARRVRELLTASGD